MNGFDLYANYYAASNDCAQSSLPWFKSIQNYVEHAWYMVKEGQILDGADAFRQWAENFEVDKIAYKKSVNISNKLNFGFWIYFTNF